MRVPERSAVVGFSNIVVPLTVSSEVEDLVRRILIRLAVQFIDQSSERGPALRCLIKQTKRIGEKVVVGRVERGVRLDEQVRNYVVARWRELCGVSRVAAAKAEPFSSSTRRVDGGKNASCSPPHESHRRSDFPPFVPERGARQSARHARQGFRSRTSTPSRPETDLIRSRTRPRSMHATTVTLPVRPLVSLTARIDP